MPLDIGVFCVFFGNIHTHSPEPGLTYWHGYGSWDSSTVSGWSQRSSYSLSTQPPHAWTLGCLSVAWEPGDLSGPRGAFSATSVETVRHVNRPFFFNLIFNHTINTRMELLIFKLGHSEKDHLILQPRPFNECDISLVCYLSRTFPLQTSRQESVSFKMIVLLS